MMGIGLTIGAAIMGPIIVTKLMSHFLSLQIVTIWHFKDLDARVEAAKQSVEAAKVVLHEEVKLFCGQKKLKKRKRKKCRKWLRE